MFNITVTTYPPLIPHLISILHHHFVNFGVSQMFSCVFCISGGRAELIGLTAMKEDVNPMQLLVREPLMSDTTHTRTHLCRYI